MISRFDEVKPVYVWDVPMPCVILPTGSHVRLALLAVGVGGVDRQCITESGPVNIKPGLAHLLEHVLLHRRGVLVYETFLQEGYQFHAFTAHSMTGYWILGEGENAPLAELIDLVFDPQFTLVDLRREQDIVLSEIGLRATEPSFFLYLAKFASPNIPFPSYR